LDAKVPHHHLLERGIGPCRISGIRRNVAVRDPARPRTRALKAFGNGGFHGVDYRIPLKPAIVVGGSAGNRSVTAVPGDRNETTRLPGEVLSSRRVTSGRA
jgi:hypothetical protein